jgi:hypothetical protein
VFVSHVAVTFICQLRGRFMDFVCVKDELPQCPERLWGPPSLLFNGYQGSFPGGKAVGAWN